MKQLTRRSLLQRSAGLAAGAVLARPYIANAAATTATVWWAQGFAQEEDIAFKKMVAEYEKASGNTIDYSIVPFAPMRQKIISAVTSGDRPGSIQNNPAEIIASVRLATTSWSTSATSSRRKRRSTPKPRCLPAMATTTSRKSAAIMACPITTAVLPNHVWRSLVEKAGYKIGDIPKTWDAYYDFFKEVQNKLRAQGMRNVYGFGFQVTTNGVDPNNIFNYFLIAYGGQNIVTKDGKLHLDDPQVKQAAIKALTYPTTAYKEGFVPPGAINWNDADDNNAFHSKQIVMDLDGTISTEVALFHDKDEYDDIVTMGLPLSNDGKPVPSHATNGCGLIPKGAKNVAVAKEFLKYPDPAEGRWRISEGWARPEYSRHAVDREERPVVARRPASQGLHPAGICSARRCRNSGLSTRPIAQVQNTHVLGIGLGRHHAERDGAAKRRRRRRSSRSRRSSRNTRSPRADGSDLTVRLQFLVVPTKRARQSGSRLRPQSRTRSEWGGREIPRKL